MTTTTSPTPPPPPAAKPNAAAVRRRRSMESLSAILLVVAAMPASFVVNLAAARRIEQGVADSLGLGVALAAAALGTVLGWHARQRIRQRESGLHGMTSANLAMYVGFGILTAAGLVMLRVIFRPQ